MVGVTSSGYGSGGARAFSSRRLARVRDLLERLVDSGFAPGAVFAVARRGEVHVTAASYLAFEGEGSRTPMASDTIFRIASMTKPLVAACAMWLYGIARNVLREPWRASRGTESAAIDEMRVDPWDGIDDRLDSASRAQAVMSAVRALPAVLRVIGQVRRPAPRVLEDAREALWSAVASAMLGIGPAGEQTTTTGRSPGRQEDHRTARRHEPDCSQNDRRMSSGGADPGN
jgi:Beta-lactamase